MSESMITSGVQLVNDLNNGMLRRASSTYLTKVKSEVGDACEELIEVGARVRPLMVGGKQFGWVRGVHLSERKALQRWVYAPYQQVEHLIRMGTTLSREEITRLSTLEVRSLLRLVEEMTRSDLRLYAYLGAFTTTSQSEHLWFAQGTQLCSFRKRTIELPDGAVMTVDTASDHARLWATLCNYREAAKKRVDESMNALLIVRPWAGKSVDRLSNDLKKASQALVADSMELWKDVVSTKKITDVNDGWAHGEDDSLEGIQRELRGMVSFDRHEQVMAAIERQQVEKAEADLRRIAEHREQRQREDFPTERVTILSQAQVREQQEGLRRARPSGIDPSMFENKLSPAERLAKYSGDGRTT